MSFQIYRTFIIIVVVGLLSQLVGCSDTSSNNTEMYEQTITTYLVEDIDSNSSTVQMCTGSHCLYAPLEEVGKSVEVGNTVEVTQSYYKNTTGMRTKYWLQWDYKIEEET